MRLAILLLLVLFGQPELKAQELFPCLSTDVVAATGGWPESIGPETRCREKSRVTVNAPEMVTLRALETEDFAHSGSTAHIAWANEAMERAAQHFKRFAQVPKTTIIFSGAPTGDLGVTLGGRSTRECFIVVYEGTMSPADRRRHRVRAYASERELKLTIAHEMFHCMQWTFASAQYGKASAEWWVEGSAEYMGNEVFPEFPLEAANVVGFDQHIHEKSIFLMDYENVVFFAFLAGPRGLGSSLAFKELFLAMPTGADSFAEQQAAMSRYPAMSEIFQRFAEDYRDRKIVDPGGRTLESTPAILLPTAVEDGQIVSMVFRPWTIRPKNLKFPSGTNWRLLVASAEPNVLIEAHLANQVGHWKRLPYDVLACGSEQQVHVLSTSTVADGADRTVQLRVAEKRDGDARECPCPLGPWTISREDIDAHYMITSSAQQLALGARRGSERDLWNLKYVSGEPLLYFNRDGTAEYSANLLFSGAAQAIQVPAACYSEDCARACAADRLDRRTCVPKRRATQQVKIRHEASISWNWRARAGHLLRTTTQVSGKHTLYINSGFGDRAQQMPVNTGTNNATADNVFRCVGKELIIENPSTRGGASSLESMIAQLAAGTARQREAAAAATGGRTARSGDDSTIQQDILRALQANPNTPAYPFTGRFVRP